MNKGLAAQIGASVALAAAILLGGASAGGYLANFVLQALCLALLLAALWSAPGHWPREAGSLLMIAAAMLVWLTISLIPLPPLVWSLIPGRDEIERGFSLLGEPLPWLPLSLTPAKTVASAVSLLPPLAVFVLAVRSGQRQRLRIVFVLLGLAALSCLLGLAQFFGGTDSSLRFYAITSVNRAVGFFANGNFFVTLMLCAIPFTGAAYFLVTDGLRNRLTRSAWTTLFAGLAGLFALGVIVNASVAGLLLLLPAAATGYFLARGAFPAWLTLRTISIGAAVFAVAIALTVALAPTDSQLAAKVSDSPSSRKTMVIITGRAIAENAPFGTGLGSFQEAYRSREAPELANTIYVNHAHNDYAEFLLELGLAGLALIVAFLIWLVGRVRVAWGPESPAGSPLAKAGAAAVAIILIHSLVDYPVRTSAIAAVGALACALLVTPLPTPRRKRRSRSDDRSLDLVLTGAEGSAA